jgi:hypothetical protein
MARPRSDAIARALDEVEREPHPRRTRGPSLAARLKPFEDRIVAQLDRGFSASEIARRVKTQFDLDDADGATARTFEMESIRKRIGHIIKTRRVQPAPQAQRAANTIVPTHQTRTFAGAHAGFSEDPV